MAPRAAENFRCLCNGLRGTSATTKSRLWLKDTVFHRITPGLLCEGGDIETGDGTGGDSIYGGAFDDDNFFMQVGPTPSPLHEPRRSALLLLLRPPPSHHR